MSRIVGVIGAVTPPGRLATAVRAVLDPLAAINHEVDVVDLATLKLDFADGRPASDHDDDSAAVLESIGTADGILLASPVYRASLTGALKNVLDLLPVEALQNKPVAILAMGASPHHFLGVESHLRDILAWFGAITLPTNVYLQSSDFVDGKLTSEAEQRLGELATALATVATWSRRFGLGPTPFAGLRRG